MSSNDEWLAREFDRQRGRLRAVAAQLLGTPSEAEDVVQEAWVRLSRSEADTIDNLAGWLTTVVSRISLDMLRSRGTRDRTADAFVETTGRDGASFEHDPELGAVIADGVDAALMVVLDTLNPGERLAFVLHDVFEVPFNDIGAILGRSPPAAKQLASRARNKVRGPDESGGGFRPGDRAVVDAFLSAARGGHLAELIAVLAPGIELHADVAGVSMGAPGHLIGANDVAESFSGRALGACAAVIDGVPGLVWIVEDRAKVAWEFTIDDDRVVRIDMVADPDTLAVADVEVAS